ncbi:MAG TPA: hypothetical protein VIC60_14620, partial [Thermomicrobiales bacterium]
GLRDQFQYACTKLVHRHSSSSLMRRAARIAPEVKLNVPRSPAIDSAGTILTGMMLKNCDGRRHVHLRYFGGVLSA